MALMDKKLFAELVTSMEQMNEIAAGRRKPSRTFVVDAVKVKRIRAATGLSQARFARLVDVDVSTLRNWEQGRRSPTGPARALLKIIDRDPDAALRALSR
jgi:putative transcriptional regulator